jgi:hypothetical protein
MSGVTAEENRVLWGKERPQDEQGQEADEQREAGTRPMSDRQYYELYP